MCRARRTGYVRQPSTVSSGSRRNEFGCVCYERFAGEANRFRYRLGCHRAAPLFDYRLPSHPAGDLLQDIGDQYPRAAEDRFAVADIRVSHDKTTDSLDFHLLSIANLSDRSNHAHSDRGPAEARHQPTSAISSHGPLDLAAGRECPAGLSLEFVELERERFHVLAT